MNAKKVVLKVDLHNEKARQKAFKAISGVQGLDSLSMDRKEQKLTVIGDVDPVELVAKLKKKWHTEIVTVGPAKEPEKKPEPKPEPKKLTEAEQMAELVKAHQSQGYHPWLPQPCHMVSCEENPNSCVIL